MTPYSALDALRAVGANEQFPTLRDMLPALGVLARAMVGDADFAVAAPPVVDALPLPQRLRILYLATLLHGRMSTGSQVRWGEWLASCRHLRAPDDATITFFHSDAAHADRPCHDDVAIALGLRRGVDIGKLQQLLRTGVA